MSSLIWTQRDQGQGAFSGRNDDERAFAACMLGAQALMTALRTDDNEPFDGDSAALYLDVFSSR